MARNFPPFPHKLPNFSTKSKFCGRHFFLNYPSKIILKSYVQILHPCLCKCRWKGGLPPRPSPSYIQLDHYAIEKNSDVYLLQLYQVKHSRKRVRAQWTAYLSCCFCFCSIPVLHKRCGILENAKHSVEREKQGKPAKAMAL